MSRKVKKDRPTKQRKPVSQKFANKPLNRRHGRKRRVDARFRQKVQRF